MVGRACAGHDPAGTLSPLPIADSSIVERVDITSLLLTLGLGFACAVILSRTIRKFGRLMTDRSQCTLVFLQLCGRGQGVLRRSVDVLSQERNQPIHASPRALAAQVKGRVVEHFAR